ADAFRFLQKPNPHFETEIGRSERADRADINRVERIIIFQTLARMRGQHGVAAAINKSEHIVIHNLLAKTNATRTENAALIVQGHARSQLHRFRFLDLVLQEARAGRTVLDTEFLKLALAGLIADRAIERMIDEEEFHHTPATFL